MITSDLYDRIQFASSHGSFQGTEIPELIGLDSEAFDNGEPFLLCHSTNFLFLDLCKSDKMISTIEFLLDEDQYSINYACWNLKYDSGAILYFLPVELQRDLWKMNYCKFNGYRIEYIPHKCLTIRKGREQTIKIWDICQFFASSLDKAAFKYFGENKDEIETKTFTKDYVKKHRKKILSYCQKDVLLTTNLGNFFLAKLSEFGVRTTALYSGASLSMRYYQDRCTIIGVKRFVKNYEEFLKCAIDSYQGGKFEITQRGRFKNVYEYDIVSAYPSQIRNLVDISFARIVEDRKYHPDAAYAFLYVTVETYGNISLPMGVLLKNTRVYANGKYSIAITKNEYEYLKKAGVRVRIKKGFYLFIDNVKYPYRETTDELYKMKAHYKGKDEALYNVSKVMLNGFYGKFVQCIEDWTGVYKAGIGFNPIYASIITANTRLQVTEIQNELQQDCIAVHTDSVMCKKPIDKKYLTDSGEIGKFEKCTEGEAIIIACGCYQVGNTAAFKGFKPKSIIDKKTKEERLENWYDILKRTGKKDKISTSSLQVESWISATAKGHTGTINKFEELPKDIDLNCEIKRNWNYIFNASDFLNQSFDSEPITFIGK